MGKPIKKLITRDVSVSIWDFKRGILISFYRFYDSIVLMVA
ncbi:hypothetical protein VCR17J2_20186 [Vibrio coralliirubri]|nr:hypothetical protein VCR17J2_20186 [Vibrio coralliirubri]